MQQQAFQLPSQSSGNLYEMKTEFASKQCGEKKERKEGHDHTQPACSIE